MREVPARSPWVQAAAVLGGFIIGPFCAFQFARLLTPESELVQAIAPFTFALVFVGGSLLWMGLGIATVVTKTLWGVFRDRPAGARSPSAGIPPGYRSFVVLGVVLGLAVGLLSGILTPLTVPGAMAVWASLGLVYGLVLWLAAHQGYLPFPEPD